MTDRYVVLGDGEVRSADELVDVDVSTAPASLTLLSQKKNQYGNTSVEVFLFNIGEYVIIKDEISGKAIASTWNLKK